MTQEIISRTYELYRLIDGTDHYKLSDLYCFALLFTSCIEKRFALEYSGESKSSSINFFFYYGDHMIISAKLTG